MASEFRHPGLLIVLCGPSGVGKSTIARLLTEKQRIRYIDSITTRRQRPGDEKGKTYIYVSQEEFLRRLDANEFLEYAQVHGNYYGTPKQPALNDIAAGADVLLEIDVQGALQVRYGYPDALTIFILPPDEPTLLSRLQARGRDTPEEITRRFRAAKSEIHMAKGSRAFDYMVINDNLDLAVQEITKIIRHKRSGGM